MEKIAEYLAEMIETQKKGPPRGSVRFDPETDEKVAELMRKHGVTKWAEYLRGLIYLDADLSGIGTRGLTRPGWVSRSYDDLLEKLVRDSLDKKATKR
jgi:hypothetical protein